MVKNDQRRRHPCAQRAWVDAGAFSSCTLLMCAALNGCGAEGAGRRAGVSGGGSQSHGWEEGEEQAVDQSQAGQAELLAIVPAGPKESVWSTRVGKILPDDSTVWCSTSTQGNTVQAKLEQRGSDGSILNAAYPDPGTTIQLRAQCQDNSTNEIGAPLTGDETAGSGSLACPDDSKPLFVRCMLRTNDGSPFVYGSGSTEGGDPCGDGVASILQPRSGNGFLGQVTGQVSLLSFNTQVDRLFNKAEMEKAMVYGTDLGYTFYHDGALWSGYGDTWENASMTPALTLLRGSVLFRGGDLDPLDGDGLRFSDWVRPRGSWDNAKEVIPSCHNDAVVNPLKELVSGKCDEISAIGTAGFGLHDGGKSYRVLWFDAIANWEGGFKSKVASLAWSEGPNDFLRGDEKLGPTGTTPPRWPDDSHFGAGAILQDRLNGLVYFYGQQPYRRNGPIRLARVRARIASILDQKQYEYWDGEEWRRDSVDPVRPSRLGVIPSTPRVSKKPGGELVSPDIIPGSSDMGPEFSVAFDAYANRYVIMAARNQKDPLDSAVELWESPTVTGPFKRVDAGMNWLPHSQMPGGRLGLPFAFYGPYTSEQLMTNGGQTISYQLSEWQGSPSTVPYNVGLWTFSIDRNIKPGCVP